MRCAALVSLQPGEVAQSVSPVGRFLLALSFQTRLPDGGVSRKPWTIWDCGSLKFSFESRVIPSCFFLLFGVIVDHWCSAGPSSQITTLF